KVRVPFSFFEFALRPSKLAPALQQGKKVIGQPFEFDQWVYWTAVGDAEGPVANGHRVFLANAKIQEPNNHLFYAFGGAILKIKGTVTGVHWDQQGERVKFTVQADVTIKDDYTFRPTGPLLARRVSPVYNAAHELEMMNIGYQAFPTTVTF